MKNKVLDFSVMKEEISQNNVLEMAELIAFMELRFQIGYLGSRAQKMYSDLYGDIKHKNELGYMFSDSYDLVQEGALYLITENTLAKLSVIAKKASLLP